jgi:glycosyltransferase involved in cell wall biosynthesis
MVAVRRPRRRPLVSLALPVRNGAEHVGTALAALAAQDYEPLEIAVFDNASTDETPEICREWARRDQRIQYRRFDEDAGARENFNRAFHLTSGELFAWAAHDDRMLPGYVARCAEALVQQPSVDLCVPAAFLVDLGGVRTGIVRQDARLSSRHLRTRVRSYLRRTLWVMVYGMFRREALGRTSLFAEGYGPDVLLVWQLLLRGPLLVLEEPLFEYRQAPPGHKRAKDVMQGLNPESDTSRHRFGHLKMARSMAAVARRELDPESAATVRQELLRWLPTGDFRTLLCRDFFVEADHRAARGEYVRAGLASAAMLAVRPSLVLRETARRAGRQLGARDGMLAA